MLTFNDQFITRSLLSPRVKKFWKSVNICQSYGQLSRGSFLWKTVYMYVSCHWLISILFVFTIHRCVPLTHLSVAGSSASLCSNKGDMLFENFDQFLVLLLTSHSANMLNWWQCLWALLVTMCSTHNGIQTSFNGHCFHCISFTADAAASATCNTDSNATANADILLLIILY